MSRNGKSIHLVFIWCVQDEFWKNKWSLKSIKRFAMANSGQFTKQYEFVPSAYARVKQFDDDENMLFV